MEITGRLVANAEVRKIKDKREVVSFTIAVNDYYKAKDGEKKEVTEFISCSYWLTSKIADILLKGSIVTVSGRIYLNEYKGKDGNHYAQLAFHTNGIKLIAGVKKSGTTATPVGTAETKDDLPF